MHPRVLPFLTLAFAFVVSLTRTAADESNPSWFASNFDYVLGTSLELKFEASTADDAANAERAALAEIDRLAAILSGYDPTSEFSRWVATRQEPVRVSAELFELLELFDGWRERSGGVLDAAAETAVRLWKNAALHNQVPSAAELSAAVAAMRQTHWRLDPSDQVATHLTEAPLRLNSFAKSYIIDQACAAALATGRVSSAVVNIGGDLVIRGRSGDTVGLTDPEAAAENDAPLLQLTLKDRAIATSGTYRRGVTIGGKSFSHLVDPRTAQPVDAVHSATVVSRSAVEAGALATTLAVMAPTDGVAFAESFDGIEYLLVLDDGSRRTSRGWSALVSETAPAAPTVHAALVPTATSAAPAGEAAPFELIVNLEVATTEGRRTKRPFVAVWIEDKDHFPVRTLGLWFKGGRWLPDLRAWSRAEQLRSAAEGPRNPQSIASATRGPGQYSLRWDGNDDAGKPVPPGRYTVMIEAAREHGTHQIASTEIDTRESQSRVELPGNPELSSLSVELRRRAAAR